MKLIERNEVEHPVEHLRVGMFVSGLDRPWAGTPYLLQGFLLEHQAQIDELARYCRHVVVDVEKSVQIRQAPPKRDHAERVPVHLEVPQALETMDNVARGVAAIHARAMDGGTVSREELAQLVLPLVRSVRRNPDAFLWVQAIKARGEYRYQHALNCCGLAAALGVQIGLGEEAVLDLGTGGLILDIGMTRLDLAIEFKTGALDTLEWERMRQHTCHGIEIYSGPPDSVPAQMVLCHHERFDGTGYPAGLKGNVIPLAARIAAIVDSYDALISDRPYRPAHTVEEALAYLHAMRDKAFQSELVEQFTQCLGVYPVGSLVEMASGEVAIVMGQNPVRRLRPVVVLLTGPDKRLRAHFQRVDLQLEDVNGGPFAALTIQRGLPKGSYGLDPTELYL